jgi:PAS domain S-box-containing protein
MKIIKFLENSTEQLLILQRFLASTSNLEEAFYEILNLLCRIHPFDSGGIYLLDELTGDLYLTVHRGLSPEFIKEVSLIKDSSIQIRLLKKGSSVYTHASKYDVYRDLMLSEGLHAIGLIPVLHRGELIALLNLASHKYDDISNTTSHTVEIIASQIGSVIIRLRNDKLLKESQMNLQLFFDTMDDFLIIADLNGNILHFNPVMENISGYSCEQLNGMSIFHLFDIKTYRKSFFSPMSLNGKNVCHISLITKDGQLIPVETKITEGTWNSQRAFFTISRDITERLKSENTIIHRLSIEKLVTDISSSFINISFSDIEKEIIRSLEKTGRFFDVDRAFLNIFSRKDLKARYVYEWARPSVIPLGPDVLKLSLHKFKWFINKLLHYEYIDISSIVELPSEASEESKLFNQLGIKSILVIPVILNENLIGYVGFNMGFSERRWQKEDIKLLKMAGEIFIRGLNRKWIEETLRESEIKYSYLLNASSAVIYACDISENYRTVFISENVKNILGYEREEFLNEPEFWINHIHPDDLKDTLSIANKIFIHGSITCEYRFRHKNGDYLWLYDELSLSYDREGNPEKVIGHIVNFTEKKLMEDKLNYRLEIDKMITNISRGFINIKTLEIDREIESSLKTMGQFFQVDRSYIFRFSDDLMGIHGLLYEWCEEEIDLLSVTHKDMPLNSFHWVMEKIKENKIFYISSLSDIPYTGEYEREFWDKQNIKSILGIPMISDNRLFGFLGFTSIKKEKKWSEEDIMHVKLVGEIFSNVLLRKEALESLKKSEIEKSTILETLSEAVYFYGRDLRIKWANKSACKQNGMKPEEIIGHYCYEVFHSKTEVCEDCPVVKVLQTGKMEETELPDKRGHVWLSIVSPVFSEEGTVTGAIEAALDITERKRTEEELIKYRNHLEDIVEERTVELKKLLEEKEIFLKEIHHRVKNNLQIISSLLYLQSISINNETVLNILRESQSRIKAIGLVHEKLYQSENFAGIDFKKYIYALSYYLFSTYNINTDIIRLNIEADKIDLTIDKAIPCGLIINELLTNALKYAFPDGRKGEVFIKTYKEKDNSFTLYFRDNGTGLPEDINIEKLSSLGLKLVVNLIKQIDGELEIAREAGTVFKIIFPS